jgi:NAD(P)-dependent dehydrogenase (short-subunit alcohol dehydrogenase family)
MQLKDKVAIVTGSARGIGKEIALRYAREGAKVVVCDVLDCKSVGDEVKKNGGEALALKIDVSKEADSIELVKKTVDHFGRVDILVNNAAIFAGSEGEKFIKPLDQITVEDWDRIMSVNVRGVFLCCKAVAGYMKKQGHGKIINIASTVAFAGSPVFLQYTTSKGGVVAMTRGLARSLGEFNINVNAIAPGLTITESSENVVSSDMFKRVFESLAIKRITKPEHIAAAAVFLASADSDQVTGHVLAVNAGEYFL